MYKPFVSVVVPTRNRPEYLRYCLEGLLLQTFKDFEVIVSDNFTCAPAKKVFDTFSDDRFIYKHPSRPLAMHDNWEYGCSYAKGQYVIVLVDKTVLLPSALEILHKINLKDKYDIVSWRNEGYNDIKESACYQGYFPSRYPLCSPLSFDPVRELERRFSFNVRRGAEGVHYFWGKICFGAYHSDLIKRIKRIQNRLFYPVSPDYTSMTAALSCSKSAVDIGCPMLISFITAISNGVLCARHPEISLKFLDEIDPQRDILSTFPIKSLYCSHHNTVAHDYCSAKERIKGRLENINLDFNNLLLRAKEDMSNSVWNNKEEKKRQDTIWWNYVKKISLGAIISIVLNYWKWIFKKEILALKMRCPKSLKLIVAILLGRKKTFLARSNRHKYPTIIEAIKLADQKYRNRFLK